MKPIATACLCWCRGSRLVPDDPLYVRARQQWADLHLPDASCAGLPPPLYPRAFDAAVGLVMRKISRLGLYSRPEF